MADKTIRPFQEPDPNLHQRRGATNQGLQAGSVCHTPKRELFCKALGLIYKEEPGDNKLAGKKAFIARASKNASEPFDEEALRQLKTLFQNATGLPFFLHGFVPGVERFPDGTTKIYGYDVPVELDRLSKDGKTSIHGHGDDVSESKQTRSRNDDYTRSGVLPIIINESWLKIKKIEPEIYLKCVGFMYEQIFRSRKRLERATVPWNMPEVSGSETEA